MRFTRAYLQANININNPFHVWTILPLPEGPSTAPPSVEVRGGEKDGGGEGRGKWPNMPLESAHVMGTYAFSVQKINGRQ